MRIRQAQPSDTATIVDLASALFREDSGTRDPLADADWPTRHGTDYFGETIRNDPRGVVFIAEENTPVGYLLGRLQRTTSLRPAAAVADLESMYVLPGHRSTGVGGLLINTFRAWAAEHNANVLSVSASATNERAISFYQRHGFRPHKLELELHEH